MRFSRYKTFLFELQSNDKKGIVCDFDPGTFIAPDANQYVSAIEDDQLLYEKKRDVKYSLYQQSQLLEFVSSIQSSVFGTAFVTFSGYEYVDFCKNYDLKGVYYTGICDESAVGFNSVLISPKGVDWAKNFSRIIFLSPVLSEGYIEELSKVSGASIYLPMGKKVDTKRFSNINLSREFFAKIFALISSKQENFYYDIFDMYDKIVSDKNIKFENFYDALLVFEELGFIKIEKGTGIMIKVNKNKKKDLSLSSVYNKLNLLSKVVKG